MTVASLSWRITGMVAVLGLVQAAAVLGLSYFTLDKELDSQQRVVLRNMTQHAQHAVESLGPGESLPSVAGQLKEILSRHAEVEMVIAPTGQTEPAIAMGQHAREALERVRSKPEGSFHSWKTAKEEIPMLSVVAHASLAPAGGGPTGPSYDIVLTTDLSHGYHLLHRLLITSVLAAFVVLAVVCVVARSFVRVSLSPLDRFSRAAARSSAQNLATRIDAEALPPELRSLGGAFNAMLDRLEDGVRRLSEFSSDMAHELSTPLATLLGRTQVALSQDRTKDELLDLLEGNVEELHRLSRLISEMLFLAHADDASEALRKCELDLALEVTDIAEFLETMAQERDMKIEVRGGSLLFADRDMVRRAITNLLSNAIRYGVPRTLIVAEITATEDTVALEIRNAGRPIPAEHHQRLFDRFYRIDASRTRNSGGSGLGLSIVHAIMKLHGGSVDVESDEKSTRFTLAFPKGTPAG